MVVRDVFGDESRLLAADEHATDGAVCSTCGECNAMVWPSAGEAARRGRLLLKAGKESVGSSDTPLPYLGI